MNLGEIRELAIAQVVAPLSVDELVNVNDAFVNGMVNKGYHLIESMAMWKFSEAEATITTTAGTRACGDTPSDLALPLLVHKDDEKYDLDYWPEEQGQYPDTTQTGKPAYYSLWGGSLRFWPKPDAVYSYTLRYYKSWTDLSADGDEPIFPAVWHNLLVDYASGMLALRLPATGERFLTSSRAQPFFESFQAGLLRMLNSALCSKTWDEVPVLSYHTEVANPEYY